MTAFICMILLAGQLNTHQSSPVVHLEPHSNFIKLDYGGKLLELINAPSVVVLPAFKPMIDSRGRPWCVDVKNLGPRSVRVVDKDRFSVMVVLGQTEHICSNGETYSLQH